MDQIKSENKLCYLIGDYNINLLNCEKHYPTGQFFNVITAFFLSYPAQPG